MPYSIKDGKLFFLFHKTFEGAKVGTLIDFGGEINKDEREIDCACREFSEETFSLFFDTGDLSKMKIEEIGKEEINHTAAIAKKLVEKENMRPLKTINEHYTMYLLGIEFREFDQLNKFFENPQIKKREFLWIGSHIVKEFLTSGNTSQSFKEQLFIRVYMLGNDLLDRINQIEKNIISKY